MIVAAPTWQGTGLGKCRGLGCVGRRGLGQTMGPPEIVAGPSGEGLSVSDVQNILGSMDFSTLSQTLAPFMSSGNVYTGTTGSSGISGTTLLLIGGGFLLIILLAGRR